MMLMLTKADLNAATESLLFKKIKPEDLPPIVHKTLDMMEKLVPDTGFVNGGDMPTPGDLAIAVVMRGCMPFQAAMTLAGCATWDGKKYPKLARIANDALAYPPVAEFIRNSEHKTLSADPFKIMPKEYHEL